MNPQVFLDFVHTMKRDRNDIDRFKFVQHIAEELVNLHHELLTSAEGTKQHAEKQIEFLLATRLSVPNDSVDALLNEAFQQKNRVQKYEILQELYVNMLVDFKTDQNLQLYTANLDRYSKAQELLNKAKNKNLSPEERQQLQTDAQRILRTVRLQEKE